MKQILNILFILSILSCKAQSLIKSLDGDGSCPPYDANCYEKDVNNEFEKFTGTWKYQNGAAEITFKLKKELHYQISSNSNYMDLLVGEYRYIENGVVIVNTLSDFDNAAITGYEHKIKGGVFVHTTPSYCLVNSQIQDIKIELMIAAPNDFKTRGNIILHYVNDNGVEKLQVCVRDDSVLADDPDARIDIPDGYYVFVKQD